MGRQTKQLLISSLVFSLIFSLILSILPAFSAIPPSSVSEYAPDEILVVFKPSAGNNEIASIHRANNTTLLGKIPPIRVHRVKIPPNQSLSEVIERYKKNPLVELAEPNYTRRILLTPDDTLFSSQWGLQKIQAESAWNITTGEESTTIAVVDTGVDYTHEDLAGKVIKGYDYHNNDSDPMDDNGHGTKVAGVAAAVTNNSTGIAGVSWKSKILAVKVLGSNGVGYDYNVACGIIYAADSGAKIINLSLGAPLVGWVLGMATNYAQSKGSLLIAGVGNDGQNKALYPSAYSGVIGVGATDSVDTIASWSNYGSWVDVVAPGVNIRSTDLSNSYSISSGTSLATPHVAGLAALVTSKYPTLTDKEITTQIQNTTDDLGSMGRDDYYGYGRINAYGALSTVTQKYEETSSSVSYAGTWTNYSNSVYSGGSTKYSNQTGATATFAFTGTSVTLIAAKASNRGIAKVYIDDIYQTDVDLYSSTGLAQEAVYTKTGLTSGTHSIKIEVTGTKNVSSSNTVVDVDAFYVLTTTESSPPTVPSGLVATSRSAALDLVWSANTDSDLAGYKIYYGTASGSYGTPVDVGNVTSYRLKELTNGTTYYLTITAYDTSRNESAKSTEVSATPMEDGNPSVPAGLSATSAYNLLNLSWNANIDSDLAGYKVYYGTASGVYGAPIDVGNKTSYKLTGLTGGTTYYLAVSTYDLVGNESAKSSEISAVPMNTRHEETSSQIIYTDTWYSTTNSNASGGSFKWAYTLGHWPSAKLNFLGIGVSWISYKSPDSGIARVYLDGVQQGDIDLYSNIPLYQVVAFTKTGLTPDWHTIEIIEIGLRSSPSSDYRVSVDAFDILATADTTPPDAPTGLATATGNGSVSLSWDANTEIDIAGYNIYRSTTSGGSYTKVNSSLITGTSYVDTGLANGITYYYTITAVDTASNESAKSSEVSATPISVTRYEETSSSVSYTGTWTNYSNSAYSGGSTKYSNQTGATATFAFTGTSVTLIAAKASNRGIAKVYIDSVYQASVDLYSSTGIAQQAVYTKTGLTSGAHSIKIEVTGTKNASSSGTVVDVDAFDVGGAVTDTTPPSAPTNLTATAISSSQINLSWTASTDNVGVTGYKIERSLDGTTGWAQIGTTSSTTYSSTGLSSSTTYYYRVRAYDAAGNNSSYSNVVSDSTWTRYEETNPAVSYTSTWTNYSNSAYSGGSTKYSNQTGATATFAFTGTSVTLIAAKASNRGIAKVYIDSVYQASVDLYSSTGIAQQAVYTKTGLTSGAHSIKVEVTGTKNASSSNTVVDVDAFDVE